VGGSAGVKHPEATLIREILSLADANFQFKARPLNYKPKIWDFAHPMMRLARNTCDSG
jgi:hypothetical protein